MNFKEWFYSASHRAKYTNDTPAYLAAQEAWEAAHEACAKAVLAIANDDAGNPYKQALRIGAEAIRARSNQ
jgi:hypothetical protein